MALDRGAERAALALSVGAALAPGPGGQFLGDLRLELLGVYQDVLVKPFKSVLP